MPRIKITGADSVQKFDAMEEVIGKHRVFIQGTDRWLLADFGRRSDADLAITNLNLIPGIKAEFVQWPQQS